MQAEACLVNNVYVILANVGNLTNHVLGNVHADNLVVIIQNGLNVSCLSCCSCVSYIPGDGLLSSGVILSYLSFLVVTSGYTLIQMVYLVPSNFSLPPLIA